MNAALASAHAKLRRSDPALPDQLAARQADAFDRFSERGYPTLKHEGWRYTNLRPFRDAELLPVAAGHAAPDQDAEDLADLVLTLDPAAPAVTTPLPNGVRALTLRDALDSKDPILSQFGAIAPLLGDALVDLNDAFALDALIIDVTDDAAVSTTIAIDWRLSKAANELASPRLFVHMGQHAELSLVERRIGRGAFTNAVTELSLSAGSRLSYVDLNAERRPSRTLARVSARIARDARLAAYSLTLGGQLNRIGTYVELAEPGAEVVLSGTFLAGEGEHVDHHTAINHTAAHTHSVEDYRGIIGRAGRGVFNGKVIVARDSQKITSQQSNDNLLLDEGARIDTKPELEIFADDVACSHGATIGRLDDQALFYLRSRGLDERTANRVLMEAFGKKPLEHIPERFVPALENRMRLGLKRLSEDHA
ncbi:MAG: Fe-S cluster assembly protein SufD [Pseudomonadota bacterium]